MMKKIALLSASILLGLPVLLAQPKKISRSFIDKELRLAVSQYKLLAKSLPQGVLPRSYDSATSHVITSKSDWWCSGFYPGTLLYLYEYSADESLKQEILARLHLLEKEQFNKNTHDLGFMMYCSYGNAYRLWKDESYKTILVNSAHSLAARFQPAAGVIRSWNFGEWKYPVIIDNMMNLELLTRATAMSGDTSFRHVAAEHANNTMINHFRSDYSSYHLVDYDPQTGKAIRKETVQGAADSSSWSRGQAWGLYGYTVMFRETGMPQYLQQARHIAQFILHHPRLPADKIPYWDFDAPDIPGALRDASAAAVMASAFIELSMYVNKSEKKEYRNIAAQMLRSLASPAYRARGEEKGGFLLKHSVGFFSRHSEIDVPLSYADYYYVEALMRYRERF